MSTTIPMSAPFVEYLRSAMDDITEGVAQLRDFDLAGATMEIGDFSGPLGAWKHRLPTLTLRSADREHVARFTDPDWIWERAMVCDDCGEEEWTEHAPEDWSCGCKVRPERDNPDTED